MTSKKILFILLPVIVVLAGIITFNMDRITATYQRNSQQDYIGTGVVYMSQAPDGFNGTLTLSLNSFDSPGSHSFIKKGEFSGGNTLYIVDAGAPYDIQLTYGGRIMELYTYPSQTLYRSIELPSEIKPATVRNGGNAECHFLGQKSIFCYDFDPTKKFEKLGDGWVYYVYNLDTASWNQLNNDDLIKGQFIFNAHSSSFFIHECVASWTTEIADSPTHHCERIAFYLQKPGQSKIKVLEISRKDGEDFGTGAVNRSTMTDGKMFYVTIHHQETYQSTVFYKIDPDRAIQGKIE